MNQRREERAALNQRSCCRAVQTYHQITLEVSWGFPVRGRLSVGHRGHTLSRSRIGLFIPNYTGSRRQSRLENQTPDVTYERLPPTSPTDRPLPVNPKLVAQAAGLLCNLRAKRKCIKAVPPSMSRCFVLLRSMLAARSTELVGVAQLVENVFPHLHTLTLELR